MRLPVCEVIGVGQCSHYQEGTGHLSSRACKGTEFRLHKEHMWHPELKFGLSEEEMESRYYTVVKAPVWCPLTKLGGSNGP